MFPLFVFSGFSVLMLACIWNFRFFVEDIEVHENVRSELNWLENYQLKVELLAMSVSTNFVFNRNQIHNNTVKCYLSLNRLIIPLRLFKCQQARINLQYLLSFKNLVTNCTFQNEISLCHFTVAVLLCTSRRR